jgi:hypothetical protein
MAIHRDPEDKPNMRQFTRFLIDSPLEVLDFNIYIPYFTDKVTTQLPEV